MAKLDDSILNSELRCVHLMDDGVCQISYRPGMTGPKPTVKIVVRCPFANNQCKSCNLCGGYKQRRV